MLIAQSSLTMSYGNLFRAVFFSHPIDATLIDEDWWITICDPVTNVTRYSSKEDDTPMINKPLYHHQSFSFNLTYFKMIKILNYYFMYQFKILKDCNKYKNLSYHKNGISHYTIVRKIH